MKKIFILLIGCTLLFSCSKEKSEWEKEQEEILNVIVGKWGFSRFSEDSLFTQIHYTPEKECEKLSYLEFNKNGICESYDLCNEKKFQSSFEIVNPEINKGNNIVVYDEGFLCWPRVYTKGQFRLYNYSNNFIKLKLLDKSHNIIFYIELKRIN